MVAAKIINTVLKRLEKYLVRKNDFLLNGQTYDMILFVPTDKYLSDAKYSLLISSKHLNNLNQKEVIKELLNDFKEILKFEEYNSISRLNIIHSEDPLVKNLKFVFGFRESIIEINNTLVGGVQIDYALLVKSLVLDKLVKGKALILEVLNQENIRQSINVGVIRMEKNFDIVYYTGKGLREIWKTDMTDEEKQIAENLKLKSEEFLIANHYVSKVNLGNVYKVI
ncbi:MAG TPA: hypothetical protein VF455_05070 [Chryseobacterium sp.]